MHIIFLFVVTTIIVGVAFNLFRYVKYSPRYRIFFAFTDVLGTVKSRNICLLADNKEEAEKRLKRIFSGISTTEVVIHSTSLVKPDIKIDILNENSI